MAKIDRNTWLIILLVLLNVLSLGALWFTNTGGPPREKRSHEARMDKFLKVELGLDDEQLAKFQNLRKNHFKERKENVRVLRQKKRQLIETVAASETDSITIQNLIRDFYA